MQDIIELSRLQGADVVQGGTEVDLNAVVAEAVDRNKLTAESRHIELSVGGNIGVPVFGDAELLTTALRNLIDNAIRYAPERSKVGVGLRVREGLATVSVTDQGPGITPDQQDRIFERFYRLDDARSRQTGGTGLGLSIVKHVISQHGGEVSVWSQPGQGSTFTVRLPEMEQEDGGATESVEPRTQGAGVAHEQGVGA